MQCKKTAREISTRVQQARLKWESERFSDRFSQACVNLEAGSFLNNRDRFVLHLRKASRRCFILPCFGVWTIFGPFNCAEQINFCERFKNAIDV